VPIDQSLLVYRFYVGRSFGIQLLLILHRANDSKEHYGAGMKQGRQEMAQAVIQRLSISFPVGQHYQHSADGAITLQSSQQRLGGYYARAEAP